MDKSYIQGQVAHLILEELGLETVPGLDQRLVDDLNADSLDMVEITMAVEEEWGFDISDEDALKWSTVGDVAEYVATHVLGATS